MNEIVKTTEIPQDFEAEQALLGAILKSNRVLDQVSDFLGPQAFFFKPHRMIYESMLEITEEGAPLDELVLGSRLKEKGQLDEVGGYLYLAELPDFFPISSNPGYYAQIIHEKYLGREVVRISGELTLKGRDPSANIGELLQEAETKISEIALKTSTDKYSHLYDVSKTLLQQLGKKAEATDEYTGIRSGFTKLDQLTSGWQDSDLVIIAARPSMGKTAFGLNMATHAAMQYNKPVLIFSLEMQKEQIAQRILSSEAHIDGNLLKNPREMLSDDWQTVEECMKRFEQSPIYINDTPGIRIHELAAIAKRLDHQLEQDGKEGLALLIVDYLQLIRASGRVQNREQEISEISRTLKGLAKELNVPVLALAQLNRELESRSDKRPILSDLRESGAIEQDADIILFLHREEVYNPDTDKKNIAEILVKKHRNGATGNSWLRFIGKYMKFGNITDYDDGSADSGQSPQLPDFGSDEL